MIATPIVLAPPPEAVMDPAASWYVDQVRRLLEEEFGDEYAALGLQVTTAVDLKMQRAAEEALQKALAPMQKRLGGKRGKKKGADDGPDQSEFIEGALVAIDPENAQVKALVGGLDYQRSVFNRAVLARRQPGSSFKPFVYATAVDHGYTQDTVVLDAPISLPDGRGGSWTPKNFGNRYMGSVPLKVALTNSLNTVSVRLTLDVGVDQLRDHLRAFGFPTDFPRNLSLALGSSEVTLLDMVRAYGVFATLGKRFDPVFVTSVTDPNGNPVEFPGVRARYENVVSPRTAWIVSDMMRSVVERGTATAAKKLGRPAAGKTGTTNDSKDAWFVGFTPDLVTGVWVGFDADRTLGKATGGKLAAPIWTDFMAQALEGRPVRDLPIPEGVDLPGRPTPTPPGASPGPGGSPGPTRKPKPTPTPEALQYDPEEPDRKPPDDPDLVPDAPSRRPERSGEGVGEPAGEGF